MMKSRYALKLVLIVGISLGGIVIFGAYAGAGTLNGFPVLMKSFVLAELSENNDTKYTI